MRPQPDYGVASYRGHGRLVDRVAVITGGDSGIGRAVALAYAREGADVVISYWCEHDDAAETRRIVEAEGRRAITVAGDLADEEACRALVQRAIDEFGRIDLLVNNAAYQGKEMESIEDLDSERLERTFKTNIIAMFQLVRFALPHLEAGAAIINTASIQAYQPSPSILD